MDCYKITPFNLLNVDTFFYMKKFLQMLSKSISKNGSGFEKYLIAFCMLIGVQGVAFAQPGTPDPGIPAGSATAKYCDPNVTSLNVTGVDVTKLSMKNEDYVYHVKKGGSVSLTVSSFSMWPVSVKWERKTNMSSDWEFVETKQSDEPLEVTDIQSDVLYRATFDNGLAGGSDQRAVLVTGSLISDIPVACPSEAVEFDIKGGEFAYRSEWWIGYGDEPKIKAKEYADGTTTYAINASTSPLNAHIVLKYDEFNCSRSAESPRFKTDNITVGVETNCKAECQSTTTGEYYVGTTFDPVNGECHPGGRIPKDVNHFFEDYEIIFEENPSFTNYWLGCDAEEFFGQKPDKDVSADVVGKNNYMFAQGDINTNLVNLKFQVWDYRPNPNWKGVRGKSYQYKMRAYIQLNEGCTGEKWASAQFLARTQHGNQSWDITEVSAYDNATSSLLGTKTIYGPNDAVLLKDVIGEERIKNLKEWDLIRFEVVFYGSFPMTQNSLDYFVFEPRFQQFDCAKLAIDYISAEIENVCLSPNVVCIGDYTTANAAGFPKDSHYQWYKQQSSGEWSLVEEGDSSKAKVNLLVTKAGKQLYKLVVTGFTYSEGGSQKPYYREMEFAVGGKNCSAQTPTGIDGSGVFCLPNVLGYKPNLIDDDVDVTYQWVLLDPDGNALYKSTDNDPHFKVSSSKGDYLTISLDETAREGEYKLEVHTFSSNMEQGSPIYLPLSVYRTPNVSMYLASDKYYGLDDETDKTFCPSDKRREIVAVAKNAFETEAISQYNYFWISDPNAAGVLMPRSHADSADVHIDAIPGICNGDIDSVEISVRADIKGCSSTDKNKYGIEALGELKINCESLSGKDTFYCDSKKETAAITPFPIPEFDSSCDSDPDLIIEISPRRNEVRDTMGVRKIVVRKSEIKDSPILNNMSLPWGQYDFYYTLQDGCGRTKSCDHLIVVEKGYPDIPCDQIIDLDVINGRDSIYSSKCAVKFGVDDIKIPVLLDRNSENDTMLVGKYAGRRHFIDQQDKNDLKVSSSIAKFDTTIGLYDEYDIDYTYILWKFTNGDKSSYCVQEVVVRDTVVPFFDCATIIPFEYRPRTKTCEIEFKDFKNFLYGLGYTAYDSCPEPVTPIPGELHEDSVKISKVDDSKVFYVGISDTLYWQFRDRHDNLKYCPQVINPRTEQLVVIDCNTLKYFEGTAKDSTCFVDAAELNIPNPPYGKEYCLGANGDSIDVEGVGTRSDGKSLNDPYPAGDTYITWLFDGKNSEPVTCETHVFVHGVVPPVLDCDLLFPKTWYEMPNCDSMEITLETKKVADPCVAGFMSEGIPYMNGEKIELKHKFPIGESFVTWKFWDYTKSAVDSCIQSIHLIDTEPPVVDCDTMKDDSVILHGKCSIPFEDLRDSLGKKVALEYCTRDTIWGVPYLINDKGERMEFPSEVSVGIYPIRWIFANDSLTTEIDSCEKTLYLLHDGAPIFDCNTLTSPLQLLDTAGICKIVLNPDKLPIPVAYDSCKQEYDVYGHGYVQLFEEGDFVELCYFDRENNKAVYLMDLPLGGHNVKWIFKSPFSVKEKPCVQTVLANSDAINKIDCSKLAEYVHVTMRRQGLGATFEEVRDSGLILPNLDFDVCKVLDTLYTRDDDKSIYADYYPVGNRVTITWLFRDTTSKAEKKKECQTIVDVEDGDTPIMVCPKLDATFICLDALPARFANFEEFKAAGGELVSNGVDVSEFVDHSSFKCDTMSVGDKCDYTFIRKYSIANLRKQISECEQKIHIKDTIAPVWLDDAASLTKVFDCEAEDFFPTDLKAKDECSNDIFSEYHKVNSLDGVVDGLFYTVSSNKSPNPEDCEYYNYREVREYVAVDRCRNYSDVLKFIAQVQDTFVPIINMPDTAKWRLDTVPAVYARSGCKFLYPDLVSSFPKDSISDVCDPAATKYFKITQTPAAGTVIENTKEIHFVTLHITDPCGLEDTVMKPILVQDRKEIVNIKMFDTTLCANFNATLMEVKKDTGFVFEELWFSPGKWGYVSNKAFEYDFYKGDVKRENLIYSNNKKTYAHLFGPDDSKNIVMNSMSKEGLYSIVVMDTIRQCFDTASAYVTIHGAPSIWLYSAPLVVCEKDSIHLVSDNETLYEKYKLDVNDNGEEITEEGWMINGVKYEPGTLLEYTNAVGKLQYYAINRCNIGTSSDWVSLSMKQRMSPDNLMLTTEPNNPSRVYSGESAKLSLVTKYKPDVYMWYRVKGVADGTSDAMFDKYGDVREEYKDFDFEQDTLLAITNYGAPGSKVMNLTQLGDSAQYYVLLVDSVCPAVPSNIVAIDVVKKLPTAFTPHNSKGLNDIFMEGHKVVIFNRYGQKMVESDNGWDGTCRGDLVDPGVYFYEVIINEGEKHKGSIEVVYFK